VPIQATEETRARFGVGEKFLLYVGTIEPRKNLLTLVRAFEEILEAREPALQLVIAGQRGWMIEDLLKHVKASFAANRIVFTGYLSDDELRALYSSCTLFVYPSLYEGFGLPPLEAMACGAPVIASRIPSLIETIGSAAVLIAPTDVQALTKSIAELLSDSETRADYSSAGLQLAARYSWEQTARLTLQTYKEATPVRHY
jgi:glycosyltransferase involved in cell wall biosynthesis